MARARQHHPKGPAASDGDAPARRGRGRKWAFRLAAAVLAPLLFFVCLEGFLRLAGYGYPTAFFIPRTIQGQKDFIENSQFCWRFLGPALSRSPYHTVMPAVKPPGTIRIFVLGESAAYGDPEPDFGLPRMLQTLLEARYPGTRFEVINAAVVAINSNVILPIARDCAAQDGDIWVVYMGNNEVVGPFGSGTVFGPQVASLPVIRASLAVKATRTGQLLDDLLQHAGSGKAGPSEWNGMMMFVHQQVRQDDPRMAAVYDHFARNLADILRTGVNHSVKVVVGTVASNLKDCAPFGSLHRPDLTTAQLQEWEKVYHAGVTAEAGGNFAEATNLFAKAAQADDRFADLQFRWARCCLALGSDDEARQHFILARDLDTLRFRADSRINETIRQAATGREKEGILFADTAAVVAEHSPHQLPGGELLYEHVHFNFAGNYLLARTFAERTAQLLPVMVQRQADPQGGWLTAAECARRLAWTDWNRLETLKALAKNLEVPPFVYQLNHAEQRRHLREQVVEMVDAASPASLARTAAEYRQALAVSPQDWAICKNLANLQQQIGDLSGAAESWRRVAELLPHTGEAPLRLGLILAQQGRADEAVKQFATVFEVDPVYAKSSFAEILNDFAAGLTEQGKYGAAVQLFQQALEFKPDFAQAHINLAGTLAATGKTNEAREQLRLALQHRPTTVPGLVSLGKTCQAQGWNHEAVVSFTDALRLSPDDAAVHCSLAEALDAMGRPAEAQEHFATAVRLRPEFAEAELNWGICLFKQQKLEEARRHFQAAVRLNPKDAVAQNYLRSVESRVNN